MKRIAAAIASTAPVAVRAEVLDKQPSFTFLIAASIAASFLAYSASRYARGKLSLLGLLPSLLFLPVLAEQLDPIMQSAVVAEGGWSYAFCVWLGPASVPIAFAAGLRHRALRSSSLAPPLAFFAVASVLGGLALSALSGLSGLLACGLVAAAILANGILATIEDRHV